MKVVLVAGPLVSLGGVYASLAELVRELQVHVDAEVFIFLRPGVPEPIQQDGVRVEFLHWKGALGILELRKRLSSVLAQVSPSVVISFIPQTDVALALVRLPTGCRWTAWLQGLPWPGEGETGRAKRFIWRLVVRLAIRRADAVWTVSDLLRDEVGAKVAKVVLPYVSAPPHVGLPDPPRDLSRLGWVGRLSHEKNPGLFVELARGSGLPAVVIGDGPLMSELTSKASPSTQFLGWQEPSGFWDAFDTLIVTSHREAYSRVAVEAAARGKAILFSANVGASRYLVEPAFASHYVVQSLKLEEWRAALETLMSSDGSGGQYVKSLRHRGKDLVGATALASILAAMEVDDD